MSCVDLLKLPLAQLIGFFLPSGTAQVSGMNSKGQQSSYKGAQSEDAHICSLLHGFL